MRSNSRFQCLKWILEKFSTILHSQFNFHTMPVTPSNRKRISLPESIFRAGKGFNLLLPCFLNWTNNLLRVTSKKIFQKRKKIFLPYYPNRKKMFLPYFPKQEKDFLTLFSEPDKDCLQCSWWPSSLPAQSWIHWTTRWSPTGNLLLDGTFYQTFYSFSLKLIPHLPSPHSSICRRV